jgi:diguanylate cyclase (GGDEF)-like protein
MVRLDVEEGGGFMAQNFNSAEGCGSLPDSSLPVLADVEKLIQQKIDIPSPPRIVVRILDAVRDDDNCFAELGKIISADPALTARLLKVANSSLYGCRGQVKTIEKALAIIGINALKNIALSFIIVHKMRGKSDELFDFEYFWKRSVTAAVASSLVSKLVNGHGTNPEDTFVSGLLQDIGVLVMFHHLADDYREVLAAKKATGAPGVLIEKQLIGFTHCEVGGALLKQWGLPESIYLPVFYHHAQQQVPQQYRRSTEILGLANRLSAVYHGSHNAENAQEIYGLLTEKYAVDGDIVKRTIDTLAVQSMEVLDFFDIPPGQMKPFSEILQEANQELGKLSFSYEQMIMQLKQAEEEAKKCVAELAEANNHFREMAYSDELTGLYNHRFFQETMEKELERTLRYERGLSLLFFDIDNFKEINDTYGHLAGDRVLQSIAQRIKQCMRTSDYVVRYGGDEFAVIMPETNKKGLEVFAERIRRGIEDLLVGVDGKVIRVTTSIGAAVFAGGKSAIDKAAMFEAADKAIYLAKGAGRNTIHVVEVP